MGLFDKWPYADLHELNLDWILKIVKDNDSKIDTVSQEITNLEANVTQQISNMQRDIDTIPAQIQNEVTKQVDGAITDDKILDIIEENFPTAFNPFADRPSLILLCEQDSPVNITNDLVSALNKIFTAGVSSAINVNRGLLTTPSILDTIKTLYPDGATYNISDVVLWLGAVEKTTTTPDMYNYIDNPLEPSNGYYSALYDIYNYVHNHSTTPEKLRFHFMSLPQINTRARKQTILFNRVLLRFSALIGANFYDTNSFVGYKKKTTTQITTYAVANAIYECALGISPRANTGKEEILTDADTGNKSGLSVYISQYGPIRLNIRSSLTSAPQNNPVEVFKLYQALAPVNQYDGPGYTDTVHCILQVDTSGSITFNYRPTAPASYPAAIRGDITYQPNWI